LIKAGLLVEGLPDGWDPAVEVAEAVVVLEETDDVSGKLADESCFLLKKSMVTYVCGSVV
jgi:hypothetical protein